MLNVANLRAEGQRAEGNVECCNRERQIKSHRDPPRPIAIPKYKWNTSQRRL